MTTMRGIQVANPTGGPAGLELIELPKPTVSDPHDIVVQVRAVALNPGDTKMRAMSKAGTVMGMDGAGVVVEAGAASHFVKGDEVLWSFPGEMARHGSNAEFELVDSRLVGRKPADLPWDEAAAIPLVGLTAWEMFEDKFRLRPDTKNSEEVLLVVNGAGGVGAIAIQLAKKVFGIDRVIATAGRPETVDFVKRMGATDVISHREDIGPQLQALGVKPTLIFLNADTPRYIKEVAPHLAPFAQIGSISESTEALPFHGPEFFFGSASFHWEFMGAKGVHKQGVEAQGLITDRLAQLVADGTLVSMVTKRYPLSLATMRAGHELQESGSVIGKLVFTVGDSIA